MSHPPAGQQQPPDPQPQPPSAETTDSGRGSSGIVGRASGPGATSGFVARTIAAYIPSPTLWVGTTSTSVSPTAARPARYSSNESAPAMQPAKLPRSARSSGESESSATTSLTPTR